jgi:intracellular multiplication protein IcmO
MALDSRKYEHSHKALLRDIRPLWMRIADTMQTPSYSATFFIMAAAAMIFNGWALMFADVIMIISLLFFWWLTKRDRSIAFKLPASAKYKDKNNEGPGRSGKPEGILYVGNMEDTNEEVWFTNSDARTHILYLGTTGSGKTVGLTSMVTNAMTWASGFVYVDGKADTDLWSKLSALVRRLGRDDDLLVLNYMTGNSDVKAPSNTMNPFSSGSASYLTNMLVSLMPESQGDNAMWSERAISLVSAMMPVMTWKRDNQDMQLNVALIRDYLSLNNVIKLARDEAVPSELRNGLKGYLATLPGFVDDAYDDDGNTKPPGPDTPQYDTTTANQQHGYLAMQFTRSLQSLGDDYGYIFDTQAADVDMVDVVLNRRVLVVLIPALEKSSDEIANLGKIVAATMKGMMGSTLGATVEGTVEKVIENKPTNSATPFMTVFDEVGYYTAKGMAVMAAQARSLGFCLIFSGQDLPAMKKLVREEANSITANCNIKLFGKLEDPTDTKDFFEKTVGSAFVTEVSGFQVSGGTEMGSYFDNQQASVQTRAKASYDGLRAFTEGQAIVTFGETVIDAQIFYSNPGHAKAMRVTRFMSLPPTDEAMMKHSNAITALRDKMVNKNWSALSADVAVETPPEIDALVEGYRIAERADTDNKVDTGVAAIMQVYGLENDITTPVEKAASPSAKPKAEAPKEAPPTITPSTPAEGAADQPEAKPDAQPEVKAPATPPAEKAVETPKPIEEKAAAPQAEKAPVAPAKKLPKEIEDIIKNAALDARKDLFKDDENA